MKLDYETDLIVLKDMFSLIFSNTFPEESGVFDRVL